MIPVPSRVSQLDWALVVSSESIVTGWRDGQSGGGCIGNLNLDARGAKPSLQPELIRGSKFVAAMPAQLS